MNIRHASAPAPSATAAAAASSGACSAARAAAPAAVGASTRFAARVAPRRRAAAAAPLQRPAAQAAALLCLALSATLSTPAPAAGTAALPSGAQVVQGQASIVVNGQQMTVHNSANAIVNWQQFSIGAGNAVRFEQPSASSQVLNRVTGRDPSAIFGSLSSNGQVWLVNPNGVLFGPSARVDVAALVASTLNISDADWRARRLQLNAAAGLQPADQADIVNQGELRTTAGGRLMLIGAHGVRNEGLIDSAGGQVLLAAGATVELADSALPNLAVQVSAPRGEVLNLGQVLAAGGRIDLQAAIVNQQGIVRADGLQGAAGGQVRLAASQTLHTGADSVTSASGGQGGTLDLDAGAGQMQLAGQLQATGSADSVGNNADNSAADTAVGNGSPGAGHGGRITLQGAQLALLDGARVDASGSHGGGQVRIGGGLQGQDSQVRAAQAVYLARGASVRADALLRGDGGLITLWSDQATRAYGSFSARGGAAGGDGGLIETSSAGWLDVQPLALSAAAPAGKPGLWLLDPSNLVLTDEVSDQGVSAGPIFTALDDTAYLSTATVKAALQAGNDVVLTTSSGGENDGDIDIYNATLDLSLSAPVSLTVNAHRNITLRDSRIQANGSALSLSLSAAHGGQGAVAVRNSTVVTQGGNLSLGGQASGCNEGCQGSFDAVTGALATLSTGLANGVLVAGSTLDAGSGQMTLVGHSYFSAGDAAGIALQDSSLRAATLQLTGTVHASTNAERVGVQMGGSVTATQSLTVRGGAYSGTYREVYPIRGIDAGGSITVGDGSGSSGSALLQGEIADAAAPAGLPEPLRRSAVALHGSLSALAGVAVQISGSDIGSAASRDNLGVAVQGSGSAPVINAAQASSLSLSATDSHLLLAAPVLGPDNGPTTLSTNQSAWLSSTLTAGGIINIRAGQLTLQSGTLISSQASGTAITLQGADSASDGEGPSSAQALGDFVNQAGSGALSTPNGRWLIWALDSAAAEDSAFEAGGLSPSFLKFGASGSGDAPDGEAGSGFLFSATPQLGLSGVYSRSYDGSTAVDLDDADLSYTGLRSGVRYTGSLQLDSANAAESVALQPVYSGTGFATEGGLPVYGYGFNSSSLRAQITPAALQLGAISALDKTYDRSAAAQLLPLTLIGVVAGDDVSASAASALFDDPNAGNQKTVTASGFTLAGAAAGNYRLQTSTASTSATIHPLALSASASASDKVYDGSTSATVLPTLTLVGVLEGDSVSASASGARFADRHVGDGKTVFVDSDQITLSGTSAANYSLSAATGSASITPRGLTIGGVSAASKVYDGSTAAQTLSVSLSGVLEGDTVQSQASGEFDDKNAGTGKVARFALESFTLSGSDAGNYRLQAPTNDQTNTPDTSPDTPPDTSPGTQPLPDDFPFPDTQQTAAPRRTQVLPMQPAADSPSGVVYTASADITPAPLYYLADAVTIVQGADLPSLSGSVIGLATGDTLADATTGSLRFDTLTASSAAPGAYAIVGSGLSPTANYAALQQDPRNSSRLLILTPVSVAAPTNETPRITQQAVLAVIPPPAFSTATDGRTMDAVQVLTPAGEGEDGAARFATLDLAGMSQDAVAAVLAAREQYKKALFNEALAQLEANPRLADAPGCATPEQALSGQCLMFAPLPGSGIGAGSGAPVDRVQQQQPMPVPGQADAATATATAPPAGSSVADAPAKQPVPAPSGTATPAPASPAAAADTAPSLPSATAAGSDAAVAAAPARIPTPPIATSMPQVLPRLETRRPVKQAVIPQIQRKVALLIGVDRYADPTIPSLAHAVGDARAVAAALESRLGYETVVLENPSRATVFQALNQLSASVGPDDSVVLYYAGHGEVVDKTGLGYWQVADADAKQPQTWISNADIGRLLRQLPASQLALISDSCFSGSLVSGERIRGIAATQDPRTLLGRRAAVVMASGGNEPVFDAGKNGHSPFAWSLMQSLGQVAQWKPGSSLFEQVRFQVARELPQRPQYGASREGGHESGTDYLFEQRQLEEKLTR